MSRKEDLRRLAELGIDDPGVGKKIDLGFGQIDQTTLGTGVKPDLGDKQGLQHDEYSRVIQNVIFEVDVIYLSFPKDTESCLVASHLVSNLSEKARDFIHLDSQDCVTLRIFKPPRSTVTGLSLESENERLLFLLDDQTLDMEYHFQRNDGIRWMPDEQSPEFFLEDLVVVINAGGYIADILLNQRLNGRTGSPHEDSTPGTIS